VDLSQKLVVIVGLGRSGVAAARLCLARGARGVATDAAPLEKWSPAARDLPVDKIAGSHAGVPFTTADLVVVSPGVPPLAELSAAERAGVPVIGELDLSCRFAEAPIIAIGGTNGKSTVTTLVATLLGAAGVQAFAGGNLGTPYAEVLGREAESAPEYAWLVLEVSSFQMERAPAFHPRVNALLNVTPDHLDRYPSFQAYADAKGNAFVNQTTADTAVVPFGDELCLQQAQRGRGRVVTFGPGGDYDVQGSTILERVTGELFDLTGSELFGAHNALNAAAALACVRAVGLPAGAAREGLQRFKPLGHRMAWAGEVRGVTFYDDSKGTNVGAAVTALLGLKEPRGVLIAGGRDKLGAYDELVSAARAKARAVVLIGEAAERIEAAMLGHVPTVRASSMVGAVEQAFALAEAGDAVLLSPACSSFDMFKSYADRGDQFVAAVCELGERIAAGGERP
jgi:UDP-N-acetylmuramoylalanine--D-glutamate ligase